MKHLRQLMSLLVVATSCIRPHEQPTYTKELSPRVTLLEKSLSFSGFPDSLETVNAGEPIIIKPGDLNQISVSACLLAENFIEQTILLGTPEISIPGENGRDAFFQLNAIDSIVRSGKPNPVLVPDACTNLNNPHSFRFYTHRQGMTHNDISAVINDRSGNIWIGTYGGGVTRFDGKNFFHYTEDHGLSSNTILCLLEDSKGNIWFGTQTGAVKYDGHSFYIFTEKQGLSNNVVEKIYEDKSGKIWFGTLGGGVNIYDWQTFTYLTTEQGLPNNYVYAITEDLEGNIWIGTGGGGISRFDGNSFTTFTARQGLSSDTIICAITDKNGLVWFGTDGGGLIRFDGDTITVFKSENRPGLNEIVSLNEDNKGNLWLGTMKEGLVKYDGNTFAVFNENHGLFNEHISSITHDRQGNLWLGTSGAGFGLYQGQRFIHFSENDGLPDSSIGAIYQDTVGKIWLGSNRSGPIVYQNGIFSNFNQNPLLNNLSISAIEPDPEGNIWFGTQGSGVLIYDGEKFLQFTTQQGLASDNVSSLLHDINGKMWIGTVDAGVSLFDGEYFSYLTMDNGLSDNSIQKIIEDENDDVFIATQNGGITKISGNTIYWFNKETGLGCNKIVDIISDSEGILWVATKGKGLVRFDGTSFTHFTEKEGLVNNYVYSILEDKNRNIWAGTKNGLSRFLKHNYEKLVNTDPAEAFTKQQYPIILFKNYTQADGYLGIVTNPRAIVEDTDGTIWIGANDILTAFNPLGEVKDTIPPTVEIIGVGLLYENILWHSLENSPDTIVTLGNGVKAGKFSFDSTGRWYGTPLGLIIPHRNNDIAIQFAGITNNFANKVQYRFKLEGYEDYWSPLTKRTEIQYTNLSPGGYVFKVKAVNSDGYWSDEMHYPFKIRYPLWQMWWAWIIYVITIVILTVAIYSYRAKILREKERRKEKELLLQTELNIARQSKEFKQNFLANMSHEIRTPLTGILGMAEILNRTELNDDQREYLGSLSMSGENLREIINMVLDYSKIEAGNLQLNLEPFLFQELFEESEKLFTTINKNGLALQLFIDPDIPESIVADQQRVGQVLGNLLSNAAKFTENGKITVKASIRNERPYLKGSHEKSILIEVRDTGIGISADDQANLFKPFFQVEQENNRSFDGTGLGLALCRELVTLMGGKIGVESQKGKGSSFWFTFRYQLEGQGDEQEVETKTERFEGRHKLSVLLVEDKVVSQKVVTLLLKSLGHTVTLANNGEEALAVFSPGKFHLILMDLQMPVMDGFTAVKKLREKHKDMPPVIGLSANAFEGGRQKYMNLGMDEYITKPVKQTDFENLIEKLGL